MLAERYTVNRGGKVLEDKSMAAPTWKWEWNLNTVVVLVGFASGFVAWGYTLADIQQGRSMNEINIGNLNSRVSANEILLRRIDNHELRITNMEKAATDAAQTMKSLNVTLNDLASDMKVTREILQRLEAAQHPPLHKP